MRRPRPASTSLDWPGAVLSQARRLPTTFSIRPLSLAGAGGSLTYMRRTTRFLPSRFARRRLKNSDSRRFREGHEFHSCRNGYEINAASSRWGKVAPGRTLFPQPASRLAKYRDCTNCARPGYSVQERIAGGRERPHSLNPKNERIHHKLTVPPSQTSTPPCATIMIDLCQGRGAPVSRDGISDPSKPIFDPKKRA
jgi:hypothetical protein